MSYNQHDITRGALSESGLDKYGDKVETSGDGGSCRISLGGHGITGCQNVRSYKLSGKVGEELGSMASEREISRRMKGI